MIAWPPRDADVAHGVGGGAAILSLGAAAVHFAVTGEHLHEFLLYGVLFVLVAWFQAWWAVQYVARPSRRLEWTAIAVNLGVVFVWAWSRTVGLPVGPAPGGPEAVGTADVITTAFEIGLVVLLAEAIRLRTWSRAGREARVPGRLALALQLAAVAAVVVGTTAAFSALAGQMSIG